MGSGGTTETSTKNTGIEPSDLSVKVYGFYASTNADCSNPLTVFTDDSPTFSNMLSDPTFGSGDLPDGTYNCVIIEMSDNLQFTPTETSDDGNCVADQVSTLDVCRAAQGEDDEAGTYIDLDGDESTCSGEDDSPVEDRLFLYLSTNSTSTDGDANPFGPPQSTSDASNGFTLGAPLVVSGDTIGTFVVDSTVSANGGISDSNDNCDIPPPLFSFE